MSLLNQVDFKETQDAEGEKDTLPGKPVYAMDSGYYPVQIELAYLTKSKTGALGVVTHFKEIPFGAFTHRQTFWITSGDAKGNLPYYIRDGQKFTLPGMNHVESMCRLTTNKGLQQQTTEMKYVQLWSYEAQKEVPTEVEVLTDLTGQKLHIGLLKVVENKRIRVGNTWQDSNEKRTYNEVDRIFAEDGKTLTELHAGEPAKFKDDWISRNDGRVLDKYDPSKGVAAPSAEPAAAGNKTEVPSLF